MRSENKIRDRKVACSYTLDTKSMENGKKRSISKYWNEEEDIQTLRSGQAFHII